MDAKNEACGLVDGAFVVCEAGAICGADFAENGSAFGHDVWNAEAVADFD